MSYIEELYNLQDKVVLITGAAGQVGAQISVAYQQLGAQVIGLDKNIPKKRIKNTAYYRCDIARKREVAESFGAIMHKFGRIDILINNAGVSVFEPFEARKEEDFDFVMDVNLKGTFFCIQEYVKSFDKRKMDKGVIVNIASFYGVISPDFRIYTDCKRKNSEVYGATKAGVIQMTKYFAVHLAQRNIRVNAVSPGGIYNPDNPQGKDFLKKFSYRCPMGRMGRDTEILGAVIYLSSDAATYTTGQNIVIDGGMSCW